MMNSKQNSSISASTHQILLSDIVILPELQIRTGLNTSVVHNYCEIIEFSTTQFPPVLVFKIEGRFILVDGHHRLEACKRTNKSTISAIVQSSDLTTAFAAAIKANTQHGLRLTNADKKRVVELAIMQRPDQSDRAIAEVCFVSDRFVNKIRATSGANGSQLRIGRDGKSYKHTQKSKKASSKKAAETAQKAFKKFKTAVLNLCEANSLTARGFAVSIRVLAKEIEDRAAIAPLKTNKISQ